MRVILKKGREDFLLRRHPWIFSNAIQRVEGDPGSGEVVEVRSHSGAFLARGGYSPSSQIRVRIWTFEDRAVDRALLHERLEDAVEARRAVVDTSPRSAFRVVNAESDGFPGLVVDKYADVLVCQVSSAAAEAVRSQIVASLEKLLSPRGVWERSDLDVRSKEGLEPRTGLLAGAAPEGLVEIEEEGDRFLVDVVGGHKTGFYLDQRDNRRLVTAYASGRDVLNVFSYTGSFGIRALGAGASSVLNIDSSGQALELASKNAELNGLDPSKMEGRAVDAFDGMRRLREEGRSFDLVVLDPPKFAESKHQVPKAARAYKDVNLQAFHLLRPGGMLFTFSCSGHMDEALFQKIVADAALDAGREAGIVHRMTQAPDHPVALSFPEGGYLKGLACRVG